MRHLFYIYILSNHPRSVVYIGVTNDLSRRLREHLSGKITGFTQKYSCKELIYYEEFEYIGDAINREKEIKGWRREKKDLLIKTFNPEMKSLNYRFIRVQ